MEKDNIDEKNKLSEESFDGTDVEPEQEPVPIKKPFDHTKIRVSQKPATIYHLITRLQNDEIDLMPDFQRNLIWTEGAQSRLIESLLIQIPIPAFYFDAEDDKKWVVIDGKQRLTALKRFAVETEPDKMLKLSELEFLKELEGKTYKDLDRDQVRKIQETNIVVFVLERDSPTQAKYYIFKRINTGGEPLSSQEIRNALYQGKATDLLRTLSDKPELRQATKNSIRRKRLSEQEFPLRFLAFYLIPFHEWKDKNFDSQLNEALERINNIELDAEIESIENAFVSAMITAYEIFFEDAFRKRFSLADQRRPLNKALFESWSVNLANLDSDMIEILVERKQILKDKFLQIMNDPSFNDSITMGTSQYRRIEKRFSEISRIIQETLHERDDEC